MSIDDWQRSKAPDDNWLLQSVEAVT